MRKYIIGLFAALSLAACSTASLTPANVTDSLVCKDGVSLSDVLKDQRATVAVAAPELDLAVSKVVEGETAKVFLASKGVDGDMVVVISATDRNTKELTGNSLVLALNKGCVVGQKFMSNTKIAAAFPG